MLLEIPEDILKESGLTEEDCRVELATRMYAGRRISLGQALRLARLDRGSFERALAERDITLYTIEDLHADVKALRELGRL